MAYRQYVGARYVPLFDGAWDATKNYEPLTVVEDGNGNSYTSKKDVPSGTPLTDREYWMLTASFSGAVQQLQNRVTLAEQDIDALEIRTTTAKRDIDALEIRTTTAEGDIEALEKSVASGAILTISDSYGNSVNADNKTAPALLSERVGLPVYSCMVGGAGFHTGTLLAGLQSFTTPDDSVIKTIIIFCGANDALGKRVENLTIQGIMDMVAYIKTRFTAAKKVILCAVGMCMSSMNGGAKNRRATVEAYEKGAYRAGISFLENAHCVLHNTALMLPDMVHPNADGVNRLADALVAAYYGDAVSVHEELGNILLTKHGDAPTWFNLNANRIAQRMSNGVVAISPNNFYYGILTFNTGSEVATIDCTTPYSLVTLDETMIDGLIAEADTMFSIPGIFMINGAPSIPGAARCVIEDKVLKAYFTRDSAVGSPIQNVVGFIATDSPVTLPVIDY